MARNVKTVSFSMPQELAEKVEQMASWLSISKSACITMVLSVALERPAMMEFILKEGSKNVETPKDR